MANYVKGTNFATKDTLPTGDAGKIVKGTEIDNEFNAIASAISSKADTSSPTFTGTPAAPTAASGANTTQLATTAFVTGAVSDSLTSTATLTNKTLTSPTINTPTITGGTVSGITDLAIADGGTGASDAAGARTNLGLGSLATLSSVSTSQITDASITAAKLNGSQTGTAPIFGARAWVNFAGASGTIGASGNIASVSRTATGVYTVTFTTAMPDTNYVVIVNPYKTGTPTSPMQVAFCTDKSTSTFQIQTGEYTGSSNNINLSDFSAVSVIIIR